MCIHKMRPKKRKLIPVHEAGQRQYVMRGRKEKEREKKGEAPACRRTHVRISPGGVVGGVLNNYYFERESVRKKRRKREKDTMKEILAQIRASFPPAMLRHFHTHRQVEKPRALRFTCAAGAFFSFSSCWLFCFYFYRMRSFCARSYSSARSGRRSCLIHFSFSNRWSLVKWAHYVA